MFFTIKNHICTATSKLEKPWEHTFRYPELVLTKEQWRAWSRDPSTEHCYISCCEGMAGSIRVGEDNVVHQSHGLLVDYDTVWTPDQLPKLISNKKAEYAPQYVCTTFSEHARTYYRFEKPVMFIGEKHYKAFAKILTKKLKLDKLSSLAGFEPEALLDPAKYYDIGRTWYPVEPNSCIPSANLNLWAYEASKGLTLAPKEYEVPLEAVEEEVRRRWPGRWSGEFKEGARGLRFWDPSADNESAAIVTTEGMICFTGCQPFVSWREILGSAFVEKFEANKMKPILESTWYDGQRFWTQDESKGGLWMSASKDDFDQRLRCMKFDPVRAKGKTCSEVDEVEFAIKEQRRVDAAVPFIYRPSGRMQYNNKVFLNTSRIKCLEPIPEALRKPDPTFEDLKEHCGRLLYPYLCNFFDPIDNNIQLWHFLAWLKYFYVNAYKQTPKHGHSLVFAGDGSTGKTFMLQAILSPLMGGRAKADEFLSGRSKWTDGLAESPLLGVDDSEGAGSDYRDQVAMTQRLKALVANGELMHAVKFGTEQSIEWLGRVIICCNLEEHSIARNIPDLTLSAQNKVMLFKTVSSNQKFQGFYSSQDENRAVLAEELPHFGAWLHEWTPPKCTKETGEHRFGVNAYHHPELLQKAARGNYDSIVWEVILNMLRARSENFKTAKSELQSTYNADIIQLHNDLANVNAAILRDIKVSILVRSLHSLMAKGKPIRRSVHPRTGQEMWAIDIFDSVK
jgi:hypothetical protein